MTLRDVVSELATDIKSLSLDDRTSYRYIADKFLSKMDYFLRLEAKSREFAKLQDLWVSKDCVELIDVATNSCGLIDLCSSLKRSKDKIPTSFSTSYGLLLKVLSIDSVFNYMVVSNSSEVGPQANRRWGTHTAGRIAYLENGYLFIPNTEVQTIKILFVPSGPYNTDTTPCASPLDAELHYPKYIVTLAKTEVLKELSGVYKHMIEDEKGDDNTNQKV